MGKRKYGTKVNILQQQLEGRGLLLLSSSEKQTNKHKGERGRQKHTINHKGRVIAKKKKIKSKEEKLHKG